MRGGTEIIGPCVGIFNRVAVPTSPKVEFEAHKLAKLANEQFENLCLWKLPSLYGAIEKLEKAQGTPRNAIEGQRCGRLRFGVYAH